MSVMHYRIYKIWLSDVCNALQNIQNKSGDVCNALRNIQNKNGDVRNALRNHYGTITDITTPHGVRHAAQPIYAPSLRNFVRWLFGTRSTSRSLSH